MSIPQVPGPMLYLDLLAETVKEMDGPGCTMTILILAAVDPRIIRSSEHLMGETSMTLWKGVKTI